MQRLRVEQGLRTHPRRSERRVQLFRGVYDFPFSHFQFPLYRTRRARRNDVIAKQTMVMA
jgi:hypothetical protein